VRYEVYKRFHQMAGFDIRATDVIPPPKEADLDRKMLTSIFCFCPSGTGWGMRAFHSAALGCIPVIIQDDGLYAPGDYSTGSRHPAVLQAFEGLLLDWRDFAVRVRAKDVPRLDTILHAIAGDPVRLRAKREALVRTFTRLLWRVSLPPAEAHAFGDAPDAFDSVIQTLAMRLQYGVRGDGDGVSGPLTNASRRVR